MTTITITGKQPGKTDVTISSTVNPAVKTVVPVTVLSRNLLSYGPASGNGLTVTVAQDGSLDFSSGTESVPLNKGVRWEFDVPEGIVGVPLILSYTGNVPGSLVIGLYANANGLAGVYQGKNNTVVTIPKGTTRVELRILRGGVTAGSVSGNLKIQLELGNTAHEWMKPDVTSLGGGVGYELANLWPAIPGETKNGVTLTASEDGSYTATGEATNWTAWASSITLHPGDYYLVPNITGTGINVAMLDPTGDASNQQNGAFTVASTETWAARIFTTAATGPVNATVTPRLYKID